MAGTRKLTKKVTKAKAKPHAKPQAKAKLNAKKKTSPPPVKVTKPAEVQKPLAKVHPFAAFMKSGNSYRPSAAPMHKFTNHDTYRKKAI